MDDVSRETDVPSDDVVRAWFGQAEAIHRFVDILTSRGVVRGLIGPRESGRIWGRHILNCAVVAPLVPVGASVCDIGSGAGLPGLVWAIARPDLRLTLVEPMLRRTAFLDEVVAELRLTNVTVRRARIEELHAAPGAAGGRFDVVTARAVTALAHLVDLAFPVLRPGGVLLALKGETAETELAEARPRLAHWRARAAEVLRVGGDVMERPTTVVRIESSTSLR